MPTFVTLQRASLRLQLLDAWTLQRSHMTQRSLSSTNTTVRRLSTSVQTNWTDSIGSKMPMSQIYEERSLKQLFTHILTETWLSHMPSRSGWATIEDSIAKLWMYRRWSKKLGQQKRHIKPLKLVRNGSQQCQSVVRKWRERTRRIEKPERREVACLRTSDNGDQGIHF